MNTSEGHVKGLAKIKPFFCPEFSRAAGRACGTRACWDNRDPVRTLLESTFIKLCIHVVR